MNYNQFTIDYIEAIISELNIYINSNGEVIYLPDEITDEKIDSLRTKLENIWGESKTAIEVVKNKYDSKVQSGLFGLVNSLDLAIKAGLLISDRVILIDYLFNRVLQRKEPRNINRIHLGAIATSLVSLLPLAKNGRVIIIPSPFEWYEQSKQIIEEVSSKTLLTPDLMSMLNMLSITKYCQLHPYTIAESEENFSQIVNQQINHAAAIGIDAERFAYEGILGALLSEKLLSQEEFQYALKMSVKEFHEVISSENEFHEDYLSKIVSGGSISGESNINKIRNDLKDSIKNRNKKITNKISKVLTATGGIGSGTVSLLGALSVVSAPIAITGAILGLSATLTGLVNRKEKEESPVISVFGKLKNN